MGSAAGCLADVTCKFIGGHESDDPVFRAFNALGIEKYNGRRAEDIEVFEQGLIFGIV